MGIGMSDCTFANNSLTDLGDGGSVAIGYFDPILNFFAGPSVRFEGCSFTDSLARQSEAFARTLVEK